MTLQEVDFKGRLSGRQQQRMKTLQEDKIGTDQPYLISIFVINLFYFQDAPHRRQVEGECKCCSWTEL